MHKFGRRLTGRWIERVKGLNSVAHWREADLKLCDRIEVVEETAKDPFTGINQPEPLRHELSGCWSRRINQEHRLVYRVGGQTRSPSCSAGNTTEAGRPRLYRGPHEIFSRSSRTEAL